MMGGAASSWAGSGFSGGFKSWILSDKNVDKLAEHLLKMRGAALKFGQLLSYMEQVSIPKNLSIALEKARQSAYKMPELQLEVQMRNAFGPNWQDQFEDFEWEPFAAASIGQVHKAVYKGTPCAIKVQYPGVAESIDSDLHNLKLLITYAKVFPEGMNPEVLIQHIKADLCEECDYDKEAQNQMEFYDLVNEPGKFRVPKVLRHTGNVIVTEYVPGISLDELAQHGPQHIRDSVSERILWLVCNEMFTWEYIQSDPNPSNFFYDPNTDELVLLDFGSCHHYKPEFIEAYRQVVIASVNREPENVKKYSVAMEFFTEEENDTLWDAHIKACYATAEPLATAGGYDYSDSSMIKKVNKEIPVVLVNRSKPPPAEAWTLFRKLSGALMLSLKLRARVDGHSIYRKIILKA